MKQRVIPLMYHDVISGDDPDSSGFSGPNTAEYKISLEEFDDHLRAIERELPGGVVTELVIGKQDSPARQVLLTFDDGGVSSYEHIAPMLEARGWRGYFFITTDCIDTPAFLNRDQIKELHIRGHVIGSHSCSHPANMSDCKYEQLLDEWGHSLNVLSGIIGRPVTVASIPGGRYSRKILEAAAQSGVRQLFTSEPVQKIQMVRDCAVIGRFSVQRGMKPIVPVEFIKSNRMRRFRRYAYWNLKKTAKTFAGPLFELFCRFVGRGGTHN
jgi:peptidoglycan/xylan/chitin deacetylase (PgdA/CDA1 family)